MRILRRTTDLVYLSFADAALRAAGYTPIILDGAIAAAEGGIGAFPRRLAVSEREEAGARAVLDALDAAHDGR